MKKIYKSLFTAASVLIGLKGVAQPIPQYFWQQLTNQPYTAITGGTLVSSGNDDDQNYVDPANPNGTGGNSVTGPGFPIGFSFQFGLNTYDRVALQTNGYMYLGQSTLTPAINTDNGGNSVYSTPLIYTSSSAPTPLQARIAAFANDLVQYGGSGVSTIRMQTLGSAPNRTFVAQWSNIQHISFSSENLNFQIRLYEGTNIVDVAYGLMQRTNTGNGYVCQVGLRGSAASTDFNMRQIPTTANWTSSNPAPNVNATCDIENSQPPTGLVYRWLPPIPCQGNPAPATVLTPTFAVCPGSLNQMNITPTYTNIGYSYQWQTSTVSPYGPFNSVPNATNSAYTGSASTSTYYSVIVTCATGGTTYATSGQLMVAGTTTNSIPYYEGFEGVPAAGQLPNCSWAQSTPSPAISTYMAPAGNFRLPNTGNKFISISSALTGTNYIYTNGLMLYPGVTYSASAFFLTEFSGLTNISDFSLLIGSAQSPSGLVPVASTNGPAVASVYKNLSNTFSVTTAGIYYLAMRSISTGGSYYLSIDDISVTIPCDQAPNSPTLNVSGSSAICLGQAVSLTASGANTYQWSLSGTTYTAGSAGISNTPSNGGTALYTVVGTNTLTHCSSSLTRSINVSAGPIVSAFTDDPFNGVCPGATAVLHAVGSAVSYTWSTTGTAGSNATVMPTANSVYTVYGSNATNCISSATIALNLKAAPFVGGTPSRSVICKGESVNLTGSGASTYTWVSANGLLIGGNVTASPSVTTSYNLTGTDANTGCTGSALVSVIVYQCVGINSIAASNSGIQLYPNPNNGEFTLELNSSNEKTINVSDVSGRIVISKSTTDSSVNFNISGLSNGVYFVKVQSADKTDVIKVVKQ